MYVILAFGYADDILMITLSLIFILLLFLFKRKTAFQLLAKINKLILPSMHKKDLGKLKKWELLIVAYRYWVTKNAI